jgi:putative ABC transport system permease protein
LSISGGFVGVGIGIMIVQILNTVLPKLPVQFAWNYIAFAFLISFIIGISTGVLPAIKAAKLSPLDALRAE